jgi:hypothetical protein
MTLRIKAILREHLGYYMIREIRTSDTNVPAFYKSEKKSYSEYLDKCREIVINRTKEEIGENFPLIVIHHATITAIGVEDVEKKDMAEVATKMDLVIQAKSLEAAQEVADYFAGDLEDADASDI